MSAFDNLDPKTQIKILRDYLHFLALIQNPDDETNWNYETVSEKITGEYIYENGVTAESIRKTLAKKLRDDHDIDVSVMQGGRRISLESDIDEETLVQLVQLYCNFIACNSTQEIITKRFVEKHRHDCLWLLAKIHFAKIEKKYISFNYTNNRGVNYETTVMPFHIVYKSNNLYLVAHSASSGITKIYVLGRIENIKNTNMDFDGEIPPVDDVFKESLSAFIGSKTNVVLKYNAEVKDRLEEIISILEPEIKEEDGNFFAKFSISDEAYLCKMLFYFCGKVEIIEPASLREQMIKMLQDNLQIYK